MIQIKLILSLGHYKQNDFIIYDSYDINHGTWDCKNPKINIYSEHTVDCGGQTIGHFLNDYLNDKSINFAQLTLQMNHKMLPLVIGEFKKIKLKNKSAKWIVK